MFASRVTSSLMKKAAPSTAKVAGRVALFSASAASHPKVNPLFRPAQFHPIPAAKSVVNDVPALDNDAILARHDDNKEWSREEIAESMKNNTLSAWAVHNPDNMVHISHGEGIYLYDQDGKKYIDFNSQAMCTNQGHTAHPTVIDAIMKQLKEVPMLYGTEFSCDIRAKLSDLMAHIFPGDINTFFYTAGGAEANEAAIRMARVMTGRTKVIARYRSYHGSMGMTMQLTGDSRRWFGEPGIPGVVHMHDPWPYSFTWGENEEEITQRNLAYFRETIEHEGPNKIAAIIMESVTGTNGILAPPKGYLEGIRGICDEYGIVMICDEVMAGFGRTGKLFGFMHTTPTILPDIVTMAKGINGAVLPLGAVAVRDHVRDFFHSNQIGTGTTYNAHPTVLASAYASIKQFLSQDLTGRAEKMQPIIRAHMARMADKHKCIKQCRNIGMFGIMELQKNAKGELFASPTAAHATTAKLKKALMSRGLFTFVKMNQFFVNPPLIITEQELAEAFDIIDEALTEMDEDFEDEE